MFELFVAGDVESGFVVAVRGTRQRVVNILGILDTQERGRDRPPGDNYRDVIDQAFLVATSTRTLKKAVLRRYGPLSILVSALGARSDKGLRDRG